jgi:uncharacterized Ntn-hydrolase superfamily protein
VHGRRPGTYSIVACDPSTGEIGVAVQSKYFCVGGVVPWVRAGVGAVATQAAGVAAYGPRVLALLEQGLEPGAALEGALADDEGRETRQLGAVDAAGRAASFTGTACIDWAGGVEGDGFAAQGNILAGEPVVQEMGRAYRETQGTLAERLMAALEAAEAAGGDRRGRQSAALVVERAGAAAERRDGIDRIVDLRVDDHPEPVEELRRLLGIRQRWDSMIESYARYEAGDFEGALAVADEALARWPDDSMLLYNRACVASLAGHRERALDDLRRAIELDPGTVEMARSDSDFAPFADDPEFLRLTRPDSRKQ